MAPASTMNPKDNGQPAGGLVRTIEVKRKRSTVDALVNQISLDHRISNLHRATSRPGRLRCRTAQDNPKGYGGYPSVPPKPQTNLLIFPCHIADTVWVPKLSCERFQCNDFSVNIGAEAADVLASL